MNLGYAITDTTLGFALLAPVPPEHFLDGGEGVYREQGMIAFGSRMGGIS